MLRCADALVPVMRALWRETVKELRQAGEVRRGRTGFEIEDELRR